MTPFRGFLISAILALCAGFAQGAENDRGPLLSADFSGSSYDPGWVFKLDPAAGYQFNPHLQIECGFPFYFVHVSSQTADGLSSRNGIGNPYLDLKFVLGRPEFYFSSTVRGTAPVGDEEKGFSTGRVTFDWTNYVERTFGPLTPFGNLGIANTISDTHFFTRPFTTLGLVGHFEGGISIQPIRRVSFAASGYAITPSGEQKIYSKVATRSSQAGPNPGKGIGQGKSRPFETAATTIGAEDIAKDHGFSAWVDLTPHPNLTFELGYSRSVAYDINSLFFSIRVNFTNILRKNQF